MTEHATESGIVIPPWCNHAARRIIDLIGRSEATTERIADVCYEEFLADEKRRLLPWVPPIVPPATRLGKTYGERHPREPLISGTGYLERTMPDLSQRHGDDPK